MGSDEPNSSSLIFAKTNDNVLVSLNDGTSQVAGATHFFWCREDAFEAVDVLVVDEAGQMSLANVLAVAHAAQTVILLGDPQQLEQPTQGLGSSFKCNTSGPLGIGCCDGQTKQAPQ